METVITTTISSSSSVVGAATADAPTISPIDIKVGQQVDIQSRTWAGINKPGGHARVTKINYANKNSDDNNDNDGACGSGAPMTVDVKYILGGSEKNVELTYVKVHVELSRKSRSRKCDSKMNMNSLGGVGEPSTKKLKKKTTAGGGAKGGNNKKRKALASLLDENDDNGKVAKKGDGEGVSSNDNARDTVVENLERVDEGVDANGVWKLIEVSI